MRSNPLFFLVLLGLWVTIFLCNYDDPTDPECSNYNPCHPFDCDSLPAEKGTLIVDKVFSEGLESNLLSDNPERQLSIYLPPRYKSETEKSYPLLYVLHGYLCDNDTFFGGQFSEEYGPEGDKGINIKRALNTLIESTN